HRPDGERVGGRDRERQDDQRGDEDDDGGIGERLAERQQPWRSVGHVVVALERRVEDELRRPVRVGLRLERVQEHPQDGEEEDQPGDPGDEPEARVDRAALPHGQARSADAHAMFSPLSRPDSSRSASVAITIEAMTTTMLNDDALPNCQPPPIDRWNTKYGMFVEPGPPP